MNTSLIDAPLRGVGVLVTRPRHQAGPLCQLIKERGGNAITFPVLEIVDPPDLHELEACVASLDELDWAIFISANAVNKALGSILRKRNWPKTVRIAVIGKRSAEELQRFGLKADIYPKTKFNSEALLALPEMREVRDSKVVIFRGDSGREFLAETLRQRGADVRYVEAYRRVCPQADSSELVEQWRAGGVSVVLVNSIESLENLIEMVGRQGRALLLKTPLIVASDRIEPVARSLGFTSPLLVAASATDEAVLDALLAWKRRCP